jgi:hypothetical protein
MSTTIEESMKFEFEFTSPFEVEIEESTIGVAMITGTLLAEGLSNNDNLYTIDEMEEIAETAKGAPIFYGTTTKINPNTGRLTANMHRNFQGFQVGEITETWLDKVARKIKFRANLIDNPNFPNLISEVKKGWGVSIGGRGLCQKFVDAAGRVIKKIFGMHINHVQLLSPNTPRGQEEAQVEGTNQIEESFSWVVDEEPTERITEVHIGKGIKSVTIS